MQVTTTLGALSLEELTAVRDIRRTALCRFATWRASEAQMAPLLEAYRALIEVEDEISNRVED